MKTLKIMTLKNAPKKRLYISNLEKPLLINTPEIVNEKRVVTFLIHNIFA